MKTVLFLFAISFFSNFLTFFFRFDLKPFPSFIFVFGNHPNPSFSCFLNFYGDLSPVQPRLSTSFKIGTFRELFKNAQLHELTSSFYWNGLIWFAEKQLILNKSTEYRISSFDLKQWWLFGGHPIFPCTKVN